MNINPKGIDLVIFRLDKEIESVRDSICDGSMKTFEDYKQACGSIKGLLVARREILAVFQSYDDDDGL